MRAIDINFKFSLRADLLKTISSFTDNLSYTNLAKLSEIPESPESINDFVTHLSTIDIPYSGFIKQLIIEQFSHTSAFLYCIEQKMFPVFYIHGQKEPYKVPLLDEHKSLTYATYSPSMFDLTGNFAPRFLINFGDESNIATFLYNFQSPLTNYFTALEDNKIAFNEVYEDFKNHIAVILAHPSIMTYDSLIKGLHKLNKNYIFSHSDETKMYFKYNDSGVTMPFPMNNKGIYRSFQRNFRETNQKNPPSSEVFLEGIRLYYNEIHKQLDKKDDDFLTISEISTLPLNIESILCESIKNEVSITSNQSETLVHEINNEMIEQDINPSLTELNYNDLDSEILHGSNSLSPLKEDLNDEYIFSTSFEDEN